MMKPKCLQFTFLLVSGLLCHFKVSALEFRVLITNNNINSLHCEIVGEEEEEIEVNFDAGRLSRKQIAKDVKSLRFYLTSPNKERELYATSVIDSSVEKLLIIIPNWDAIIANERKTINIEVSPSRRPEDSFHFINASGYRFIGRVNGQTFSLESYLGANKLVKFEPKKTPRDDGTNRVVALTKIAIEIDEKWQHVKWLDQYIIWREGDTRAIIFLKDPNRDLTYDLNLIQLP